MPSNKPHAAGTEINRTASSETCRADDAELSTAVTPELLPPSTAEVPESGAPPDRFQFFISDLLLLTFAVAFGFAGGKHLPTDAFAFVLGCAVVANLLACHFLPGVRWLTVSWISLLAAYVAATVAAVLKAMT